MNLRARLSSADIGRRGRSYSYLLVFVREFCGMTPTCPVVEVSMFSARSVLMMSEVVGTMDWISQESRRELTRQFR